MKLAKKLEGRTKQKRFPERSWVNFEKEIFTAFYIIRKLAEAKKLSDALVNLPLAACSFPALGKPGHLFNWDNLDELYDFSTETQESLTLNFVCNQIIHSYVFVPSISEDRNLTGIFFSSDRKRNKKLYHLDILEITRVLDRAANDNPSRKYVFDKKKGDYIVTDAPDNQ